MNGKEYISSFSKSDLVSRWQQPEDGSDLSVTPDVSLTAQIVDLYRFQGVHFLGDTVSPAAVIIAHNNLEYYRKEAKREVAAHTIAKRQLARLGIDLATLEEYGPRVSEDNSEQPTTSKLTELVEQDRESVRSRLVDYSNNLMSNAVHKVDGRAAKGPLTPKDAAACVKDAISVLRPAFAEAIEPWRGVITLERDFTLNGHGRNGVGEQVDMRVLVKRNGRKDHTPRWLPETKEWEDPIHLLCSVISEVETLIALQQWVIDRKLPYVPVAAPPIFEEGRLASRGSLNTRADILLCSLDPSRNEIIPIQVKNRPGDSVLESYDPEVVIVKQRNLNPGSSKPAPLKYKGHVQTGVCAREEYGRIIENFLLLAIAKRQGQKPQKTVIQAAETSLATAFTHFDQTILPRANGHNATVPNS